MPIFSAIIASSPEEIVDLFYASGIDMSSCSEEQAATQLKLNTGQLICALGFNLRIRDMMDLVYILGYDSLDKLLQQRNRYFVTDCYHQLSLKQILAMTKQILLNDSLPSDFVAKLFAKRAKMLERNIEKSIKPKLIEHYRSEITAIYQSKKVPKDFVQLRLKNKDCGFRALLDEVGLMIDSKLIPASKLFVLDTVLVEEKRRMLSRGLISDQLIEERLTEKNLSEQETTLLKAQLDKPN